jgi:hypothetical protein
MGHVSAIVAVFCGFSFWGEVLCGSLRCLHVGFHVVFSVCFFFPRWIGALESFFSFGCCGVKLDRLFVWGFGKKEAGVRRIGVLCTTFIIN